jgi:hypothetical protein
MDFVAELHDVLAACSIPAVVGGDFNLVRTDTDKSNGQVNVNARERRKPTTG